MKEKLISIFKYNKKIYMNCALVVFGCMFMNQGYCGNSNDFYAASFDTGKFEIPLNPTVGMECQNITTNTSSWLWQGYSKYGNTLVLGDYATIKSIDPDSGNIVLDYPLQTYTGFEGKVSTQYNMNIEITVNSKGLQQNAIVSEAHPDNNELTSDLYSETLYSDLVEINNVPRGVNLSSASPSTDYAYQPDGDTEWY